MKSPNETIPTPAAADFRLLNPPVETTRFVDKDEAEAANYHPRSRSYGSPIVCALARNPTSLFVYWEIDWPVFFKRIPPRRREVYLRLLKSDGTELSSTLIKPTAGHGKGTVPNRNKAYKGEIGY